MTTQSFQFAVMCGLLLVLIVLVLFLLFRSGGSASGDSSTSHHGTRGSSSIATTDQNMRGLQQHHRLVPTGTGSRRRYRIV